MQIAIVEVSGLWNNVMTLKSLFYDLVVSRYYDNELSEATAGVRTRCVELLGV